MTTVTSSLKGWNIDLYHRKGNLGVCYCTDHPGALRIYTVIKKQRQDLVVNVEAMRNLGKTFFSTKPAKGGRRRGKSLSVAPSQGGSAEKVTHLFYLAKKNFETFKVADLKGLSQQFQGYFESLQIDDSTAIKRHLADAISLIWFLAHTPPSKKMDTREKALWQEMHMRFVVEPRVSQPLSNAVSTFLNVYKTTNDDLGVQLVRSSPTELNGTSVKGAPAGTVSHMITKFSSPSSPTSPQTTPERGDKPGVNGEKEPSDVDSTGPGVVHTTVTVSPSRPSQSAPLRRRARSHSQPPIMSPRSRLRGTSLVSTRLTALIETNETGPGSTRGTVAEKKEKEESRTVSGGSPRTVGRGVSPYADLGKYVKEKPDKESPDESPQ